MKYWLGILPNILVYILILVYLVFFCVIRLFKVLRNLTISTKGTMSDNDEFLIPLYI